MTDAMSTPDLMARLQRHYIPTDPKRLTGGVFVPEVGVNGESGSSSRCDAVYIGFTSTSGRLMIGHEVKTSRQDWLRELNKAGKNDTWADACHAFYVVAPSVDVVHVEEVPHGWGLLVVDARTKVRLKTVKVAPVRQHNPPSWAWRSLLARQDTLRAEAVNAGRERMRDTIRKQVEEDVVRRYNSKEVMSPEAREALAVVERFRAKGINLAEYGGMDNSRNVTPDMLAPYLEFILAARPVAVARRRMLGRYVTLPEVRRAMDDLTAALAPFEAEEVPDGE